MTNNDQRFGEDSAPHVPPPVITETKSNFWPVLCHLSVFSMFVIPFGNIISPLVIWMMRKDEEPAVDLHGKATVNFQLTISLAYVVLVFFLVILGLFFGFDIFTNPGSWKSGMSSVFSLIALTGVIFLGVFIFMALGLWSFALIVVNSVRAYDGKTPWFAPMIRFIR